MPSTRRKWIYGLSAATAAAAADMFLVEPRWLSIETKRIQVLGGKLARPVRLVQLSDLHYSWCVSAGMIRSAFLHALNQRPDVVCLTGDFVTGASSVDLYVLTSLVKELSTRVPTYAVKGNHDGGSWAHYYQGEKDDHAVEQAVAR